MRLLDNNEIRELAHINHYEYAALMAVIDVESSGHGFSSITGKMVIQFEPLWFKRKYSDWMKHTEKHVWQSNKVSNQTLEWIAFNDAAAIDIHAAMESTSIGIMQVMGIHYRMLGFGSIVDMWQHALLSEYNQVDLGIRFIRASPRLDLALKTRDWGTFAYYYNGAGYRKFGYDKKLAFSYSHYNH